MKRADADAVRTVLLTALDTAFDRRSWHGANLASALRGVTPAQALARAGTRKCVWEQLLHTAYWKHRVVSKLAPDSPRFPRKGGNWPPPPAAPSAAAWRADLDLLRDTHRRLRHLVATLPRNRLDDDKAVWLIQGAAAHDLYHAGQIKLLRRLVAG
jgi:hypothetical protein